MKLKTLLLPFAALALCANAFAAPPSDGQRLGLVVDLIDDAVEMGAGGGCRYSGHSKSVR